MRRVNSASRIADTISTFVCFMIIKIPRSLAHTLQSVRSWINANSRAGLSQRQNADDTEAPPPVPIWILPKTKKLAIMRAKGRANQTRWDLDIAVFLFGILAIVFILTYEGIGVWITAPVSIFSLIMVWLVGFRKARQSYKMYLPEELARYPDPFKDYYKILHLRPDAHPEHITDAYNRLSSELLKMGSEYDNKVVSRILDDVKESYEVLCVADLKATYDYVYWSSRNTETDIDPETKAELIGLSQSIYEQLIRESRYSSWSIPLINIIPPRMLKLTAYCVLGVAVLGTSLAMIKPEVALAAPFRGVASAVAHSSTGIVTLLNTSREVAANAELRIVSTALQVMRLDEGLEVVPPVVMPRNDMAFFPSQEHSLYPEYIGNRYSQFRYTVSDKGIMTVDMSWAITDDFLHYMLKIIERIERTEQ